LIHIFCIGNEERSAVWEILAGAGFGGNSAQSSSLRDAAFFRGEPNFVLLRCVLDKVRIYFEQNPNEF
jgi:hypothetical protein